jgi:ADP-heptose:LPS heptosyltransferase
VFQRIIFDGTSRLTTLFPRAGSRLLDFVVPLLIANPLLFGITAARYRRAVNGLRTFHRFLVIPDTHIGDSVMSQSALTALRDFFPEAHVDYVANKTAYPLIEGNPEATRVLPLFSEGGYPSPSVLKALKDLALKEPYDLCFCFCPYIKDKDIKPGGQGFINFRNYAPEIIRNEMNLSRVNHIIYLTYWFTRDILGRLVPPVREGAFQGVRVTIADRAVDQARRFAADAGLPSGVPLIFYNPDSASPFTRMPFEKQADLLGRLARLKAFILLGAGHTVANIGERLKATLPLSDRAKAIIVPPDIPLDAYVSLIDVSDVFITGDTGPLHLASARKFSRTGRYAFRNRTAVLSIFGGTPPRMSGYDSFQPGYLPANQDAPSWCYTAVSPCRNITCLNKMFKTCRTVRCFEEMDMESLVARIKIHLESSADKNNEFRLPTAG